MKLTMLSVYDSKAEAYLQPLFAQTQAVGVRMFKQAVNEEEHMFHIHAADYTLFEIGTFDQNSAKMTLHKAPLVLGNAIQFLDQITELPELVEETPVTAIN